jgi:hypothetical protein
MNGRKDAMRWNGETGRMIFASGCLILDAFGLPERRDVRPLVR